MQTSGKRITEELQELQGQIAAVKLRLERKPDYGLREGDPRVTTWELDRALLEQLNARVTTLEQALASVEQGVYGTCENCGAPIHPDRLAVLPGTKLCIKCARAK